MEKPIEQYPFIIDNKKLVKITARGLVNALDRITSKYPNKFINIKHARNMDLISAKVEAAKKSRETGKKVYIILEDDGECTISNAPLKGVLHCYNGGSEIYDTGDQLEGDPKAARQNKRSKPVSAETKPKTIPAQSQKAKQLIESKEATEKEESEKSSTKSKQKVMGTKPAKKAAKKIAAKKVNGEKRELKTVTGVKKDLKVSEIIKLQKAGKRIFRQSSPNSDGQLIQKRLVKYANQDKVIKVIVAEKAA